MSIIQPPDVPGSLSQIHTIRELSQKEHSSTVHDPFYFTVIHYLGECAGCESVCYAISTWNEGEYDPDGEAELRWETYPRSQGERATIDNYYRFPRKVRVIYREVVGAINAKLNVLAAIGLRVLIEEVCKDQKVKGRNLKVLIDGLASRDILSSSHAGILHGHRFLGNAAAHEVAEADFSELLAALEISENMLSTIYIVPKMSEMITTGRETKGGKEKKWK